MTNNLAPQLIRRPAPVMILACMLGLGLPAGAGAEPGSAREPAQGAAQGASRKAPAEADEAAKSPGVLELREEANRAYREGDYEAYRDALLKLHELRPYNGSYMALLVLAYAQLEDRSRAYEMMLTMQQQGLAWDFNATDESANIRGTEAYDYINDLLVKAKEPAGKAQIMFRLPPDIVLPTSMAWDPTRESWLIGDARRGAVHAISRTGELTRLLEPNAENGLWGIFGLTVDAPNNRLWVSSSAGETQLDYDPIDAGRSALLEFSLDSMELLQRYPVPVDGSPHRLGDLVRTESGDIYAVDTILPIIYRLEVGADRLRPYLAAPGMVSFRGITSAGDGRLLYVADYELGVLVVDLANRQATRLAAPETLNLGGIEGLFHRDGELIAIQNGNEPQRIMRLALADDGMAVTGVAPLAVAQPFFDYPNFGALTGDELVFLANSHWVRDLEQPEPILVARTPVAAAAELVDVDREALLRKMREQRSQAPAAGVEAGADAPARPETPSDSVPDPVPDSGAESQ